MSARLLIRFAVVGILLFAIAVTLGIGLLLQSKQHIFSHSLEHPAEDPAPEPFPVGVDAYTEKIIEDPTVEQFYRETLARAPRSSDRWWNQVAALFASHAWYQNLASPVSRIIVVWPGERKEQVTKNVGDVLRWDESDRQAFQTLTEESLPPLSEGTLFPGQYVAHRSATPAEIHELIQASFQSEILDRYTPAVTERVPLQDTLIIASLIEREASDFTNMREVSGVIWNRLFIDMPLQLDATLQYVRGSNPYENSWWPIVHPRDKFLSSPFNTYENVGLPPMPIANPSIEAVVAALNPVQTDCLYYFHAEDRSYHCSATYEEHVDKLKARYGRGS